MIKMIPQNMMFGNIDDVGWQYIIRFGNEHYIVMEVIEVEQDSLNMELVVLPETKIYSKKEIIEWVQPLAENGLIDMEHFEYFMSEKNL